MSEAEVESHLTSIAEISGAKRQGSTSRFKGHRKIKPK